MRYVNSKGEAKSFLSVYISEESGEELRKIAKKENYRSVNAMISAILESIVETPELLSKMIRRK